MRARVVLVGALAIAGAVGIGSYAVRERRTVKTAAARETEVRRIRVHFDSVERELLARDVSHLTAAQRVARVRHIRTLHLYRERGIFPVNRDFPGQMVPYFVDATGRLCAVAHLLATSGRRDIVDRVAARRNNAWVAELADEPGLATWLDSAGLTLEEAARIQVPYAGPPPSENVTAPARRDGARLVASAAIGAAGASSLAWSLRRGPNESPRRGWGDALAVAAGGLALAAGATQLDERGAPLALGVVNTAVGAAAGGLALHRLILGGVAPSHGSRAAGGHRSASAATGASGSALSLALSPALPVAGGGSAPGVVVSLSF